MYPGGAHEVLKKKSDDKYELKWKRKITNQCVASELNELQNELALHGLLFNTSTLSFLFVL